jgi:hypothetical protein
LKTLFGILICFLLALPAFAGPVDGKATKTMDFDGDVVEGVNKQPLDTLNSLSESDSSRYKMHLYKKRTSFKDENQQVMREMAETY